MGVYIRIEIDIKCVDETEEVYTNNFRCLWAYTSVRDVVI